MNIQWELIIAAILVWFGLKAIAEALEILAARISAHTDVVRVTHLAKIATISQPGVTPFKGRHS